MQICHSVDCLTVKYESDVNYVSEEISSSDGERSLKLIAV